MSTASKKELWMQYEMLSTDPIDEQALQLIATSQEVKGKILEWSVRDGHWEVVSYLLDTGVCDREKRKAFREVAGTSYAQLNIPSLFDERPSSYMKGRQEAVGIAIGLAAMAAHFDEAARKILEEESAELPAWVLTESIKQDGPGGKRLLEKCLCDRVRRVSITSPSGKELVHDQMAFLGQGPRTITARSGFHLDNDSKLTDMLLPRKLNMVSVVERLCVAKTRADVRVFTVKDACSADVIQALAGSPTNDVLSTDAARAIVEQTWHGAVAPYTLDCTLNFIYVAVLCQVTASVRHGEMPSGVCLGVCTTITVKDILEEILQIVHTSTPRDNGVIFYIIHHYLCKLEQVFDWSGIMLDIFGMCVVWSTSAEGVWKSPLAIWAGARWLRTLYGLRGYECIGLKMLPILSALQDTFIFMLVVCFFLAAAVHAYYVLGVREAPSPLYAAVLPMLRLGLFGDFDMFELEGVDTSFVQDHQALQPRDPDPSDLYVPVHMLFYTVGTCITLTLMNLLVGILSSNYDRYEDQSIPIFLRARALILMRYAARPWACAPWWHGFGQAASRDGYLWVATRAEVNLDDTRSMRTVFREELRKVMKEPRVA
jgi:hypothetical protein